MTPDNFIPIIEDSDALKSYTDEDPFTADEVRNTWAKDLYNSPLELVHSSKLRDLLDREEYVDALYYFTYTTLCQDQEDSVKNVNIAKIASIYLDYLQEYYNRIKR